MILYKNYKGIQMLCRGLSKEAWGKGLSIGEVGILRDGYHSNSKGTKPENGK